MSLTFGSEQFFRQKVFHGDPVLEVISNPEAVGARLRLRVPRLFEQDLDTGDFSGSEVQIAIDVKSAQGEFEEHVRDVFIGKAAMPLDKSYDLELPAGGCPWTVRVSRITPNADKPNVQNSVFLQGCVLVFRAERPAPAPAAPGRLENAPPREGGAEFGARTKAELLLNPNSTWNKAADDEPLFILRSTDKTTRQMINIWINITDALGATKEKIGAAIDLRNAVENWQAVNPDAMKVPD